MIRYKTHPDNEEYLVIGIKTNISMLLFSGEVPKVIEEELEKIYYGSLIYLNDSNFNGDVTIKKDCMLGEYILTEYKNGNEDLNITHEKIRDALNIAMFEGNEIFNLIFPLFKNLESGRFNELQEKYDKDVLNYILKRNNFKLYIDKLTEKYKGKEELVYDNDLRMRNLYIENKKDNRQKKYC